MKQCFKCNEIKPLTEFYKHVGMGDGYLNKCKCCTKKYVNDRRFGSKREEILAYDRQRAKEPERLKKHLDRSKRYSLENKKKRTAQSKLLHAVKSGLVKPMVCLICGNKGEAHHADYDKPLDVVWLCSSHHKQAHSLTRGL
jgi:hypothetical protein